MKTPKPTAEDLIQKLEGITLSHSDNEALRGRLLSYVDLHEMPRKQIVSPLSIFYTYSRFALVGTLVVLILVGGTGITFAAQNTLPGQPLYAIKVDVTEPIQGALITSPVGKVDWQNTLVERRLIEASTLAAQNNLSSSTEAYLGTQVAIHVQASEQDSNTLAEQGNASSSLSAQADLQAQLDAHTQILATITTRLADAGLATTSEQVALLIQKVDTQRSEVIQARQDALVALANDVDASSSPISVDVAASSTPAEARAKKSEVAIAYVRSQDTDLHAEEASILREAAPLLSTLPAPLATTTAATITATTTVSNSDGNSATSTASTVEASSTVDTNQSQEYGDATTTITKVIQPFRKLSKNL